MYRNIHHITVFFSRLETKGRPKRTKSSAYGSPYNSNTSTSQYEHSNSLQNYTNRSNRQSVDKVQTVNRNNELKQNKQKQTTKKGKKEEEGK